MKRPSRRSSKVADALVVGPSPAFASDVDDIVALTLRHEIPTMSERRADVIAAGLMSYGAAQMDAWHQSDIMSPRFSRVPSRPIWR